MFLFFRFICRIVERLENVKCVYTYDFLWDEVKILFRREFFLRFNYSLYRESILMGSISTVFSAEVMAILRCTEVLMTKILLRRRIHTCSDSKAALAALAKTTTESSLVWECMQVLAKRSEFDKVTLVWITEHQGTPGNEEADRLAKEGKIEVPPNQFTAIFFSEGKNLSSSSWN